LTEYGTLDNLLENAENIKQKSRREKLLQFSHQARLSRALVALEDSIPGMANRIGDLPSWRSEPLDVDRLEAFFDEMGFKDLKRRFLNQIKRGAPRKRPKSTRYRERAEIPNPEDFADVPF
jgi:DNA polymerase-1